MELLGNKILCQCFLWLMVFMNVQFQDSVPMDSECCVEFVEKIYLKCYDLYLWEEVMAWLMAERMLLMAYCYTHCN